LGERAAPFRTVTPNGHLNLARVQLNTAVIHRMGVQGYHTLWKDEWSLNAGLSGEIGRQTVAHVQGLLVHNRGEVSLRSLASARLTHTFPWGHAITAEGRYTSFQYAVFTDRDAEYSISYKVRVGVPIPSKRDEFDVAGLIYDGETGDPMAGVILHLSELVDSAPRLRRNLTRSSRCDRLVVIGARVGYGDRHRSKGVAAAAQSTYYRTGSGSVRPTANCEVF
jgi:hypothetical protein